MKISNKKGFTLIELLIVITIIGILAVAFLPTLLGAPSKGRDTQRIADLQKIQKILINKDLTDPSAVPGVSGCVTNAGTGGSDSDFSGLISDFGGAIPTDPDTSNDLKFSGTTCTGTYGYLIDPESSGEYAFGLYAKVENKDAGNAKCDTIGVAGTAADLGTPLSDDNACYVILSQ